MHPAHMSSQWFKLHYGGSSFTCHNVNGEGEFELLTETVTVDKKGVPDPENLPIPGAIESHDHIGQIWPDSSSVLVESCLQAGSAV